MVSNRNISLKYPVVTPVVKRGRKPGRGGRGKSRGGGRGVGRPPNATPTGGVVGKRERSPSTDTSKVSGRGKVAKLRKSQESPRSLRSRGSQNQSFPSPAEEAHHTSVRTSRRKLENDEVDVTISPLNSPSNESWKARPTPTPVTVQKASEAVEESTSKTGKIIPRLIDVSTANRREALTGATPLEWTTQDVATFLRVNDCANYCDTFTKGVSIFHSFLRLIYNILGNPK